MVRCAKFLPIGILNKEILLTLLQIRGVGRQSIHKQKHIFAQCQNGTELLAILKQKYPAIQLDAATTQKLFDNAQRTLEFCQQQQIEVIDMKSERYPHAYHNIHSPPLVLFLKGNNAILQQKGIAAIGSRYPSEWAQNQQEYIHHIIDNGYLIISGLALGCDTIAHRVALQKNSPTISILPSGLANIYPGQNRRLAQQIITSGGCLISEYRPEQEPQKYSFIERDRLQSGLATGVFVMETSIQGGTMHTTRFARKQQKPMACLFHSAPDWKTPDRSGNTYLVTSGQAQPIFQPTDCQQWLNSLQKPTNDQPGLFS